MPTNTIENTVDFYQLHPENPSAAICPPLINFTVLGHHPGPLPHRKATVCLCLSYLCTHFKNAFHQSIFFTCSFVHCKILWATGAFPSCLWTRGRVHPGEFAISSQGQQSKAHSQSHSHAQLRPI